MVQPMNSFKLNVSLLFKQRNIFEQILSLIIESVEVKERYEHIYATGLSRIVDILTTNASLLLFCIHCLSIVINITV